MKDVLRGMTWGVVALGIGFIVLTVIAPSPYAPRPDPAAISGPAPSRGADPIAAEDRPEKQAPALETAAAPDAAPGAPPAAPQDDASAPETGAVELPAGSEFNRPPPEDAARLPETDRATPAGTAPTVPSPARDAAPAPDTTPSDVPETSTDAPPPIMPPAPGGGSAASDIGDADASVTSGRSSAPTTPDIEARPGAPANLSPSVALPGMAEPDKNGTGLGRVPAPVTAPTAPSTQDDGEGADPLQPAPTPPAVAPEPEPAPDEGPADEDLTDSTPEIPTDAPPGALRIPVPGGEIAKPDVQVGQLPTVGGGSASGADAVISEPEAGAAKLGALARYAVPFMPKGEKPLFAVILIEAAEGGLDRASLTTFSFPVTFALDPARAGASQAARAFRQAGFEVVSLAGDLPQGATPQDVEVNLAAWQRAVPQAVAVMDPAEGGFGTSRPPLRTLMDVLKQAGQGVISYDSGLNTIEQLAEAADVPSALVFRRLDARRENAATIRRYLDRAAFKAARDGHVVMVGHTYPETVTALFQWMLEGKGAEVTMAPISAILRR